MEIGDVIVAKYPDYPLTSGCSFFTHAICTSVEPLVLVSEKGTMMWHTNVDPDRYIALCQAHPDIVKVAMTRHEREYP